VEAENRTVVIGAGPAGLAAADALARQGRRPLLIEAGPQVGGIARTVEVRGNRMDIGGHRFLSKSPEVMEWWFSILPLQTIPARSDLAADESLPFAETPDAPDPEATDRVMLVRRRLSHILYSGRLFDYPVSPSPSALAKLGLGRTLRIGLSYLAARMRPIRPESSLEDYIVNRFGRALYELFFRDYTQKVWGVPCESIDAAWGEQRIRGVSIGEVMRHAWRLTVGASMKDAEKSLTGFFYYPKLGPGQLWEAVASRVQREGGEVVLGSEVVGLTVRDSRVESLRVRDRSTGEVATIDRPEAVFSSMPLADLVSVVEGDRPDDEVIEVAKGLPFRDFITVGLLVDRLEIANPHGGPVLDTWMYVQEPAVRLGRVQFFNNWSPYLVADRSRVWLGLEYFCSKGDDLWVLSDEEMASVAAEELERIGIIKRDMVRDTNVLRVEKAYPAYFETHGRIDVVRAWADSVDNLFVMGRNGMHRYNNMDDSVLSAWAAVEAAFGEGSREAIWSADASSFSDGF
jgi:protoporphyrinogen oxidase